MAERFVIFDPNGPDIEFEGQRVIDRHYRGKGRWTLYRTEKGKFVFEHRQNASRLGPFRHRVAVFETFDELADELASSWEGKDLLEQMGRPHRRILE